ncbi:MAG: addiction module protein [Candidatus Cloacimonadota bacterium]|nr:addiction module protein [Candidatus Cloacimonadota bacterium]
MNGIDKIISEAESLSVTGRIFVIDSLLKSLNSPNPETDKKWVQLAKKRLEDIRSNNVKTVAGNEVFAKIRERFSK